MTQLPLSDDLARQAGEAWLRHDRNQSAAARSLNRARSTFQNQLAAAKRRWPVEFSDTPIKPSSIPGEKPRYRLKADGTIEDVSGRVISPTAPASAPEMPLADRQRIALEDQVKALRAELKAVHRSELSADSIRAEVYGIASAVLTSPDWLVEDRIGGSAPGVPVTIWSDWHWGEVIRPEEVAGVNRFDSDIARARLRRLVERTIDLCFNHMVRPEYPGIVICLGGDMITGEIHQELAESNDQKTLPALLDLLGEITQALTIMADRFGKVFVPCVVGNHGRATLKPRAKGRVHTSYEWHLYNLLERHFRNDDRVTFLIPGETDAHFRVYGHRYMLTHGDALGVKGGMASSARSARLCAAG